MSGEPGQTPQERASAVKRRARALGFDACGIAAADVADPEDRLGDWIADGYHADMEWMAATKGIRQDVRLTLPGARSVVVVAHNYYAERPQAPGNCGRVSRYAWGRDYHNVLRKPLKALARHVSETDPAAEHYCCIDTGPVMEKAWAVRAGIGWLGKNSLVLREDACSWFFLGVVVTTAELAADSPVPDRCGACTKCMDACPTGAIVQPYVVDARRCISYLTIEHRGDVPEGLRRHFGNLVFGCDICQEVCPWGRSARVSSEPDFHPRNGQANPDLTDLGSMGEDDFERRFAGSPLRRATFSGMQRNVRIAMENADAESRARQQGP